MSLDFRERFIDAGSDPQEHIKAALDGRQAETWTALPGVVQTVDLNAITCKIQPAIQSVVIVNGQRQNTTLPQLVDCPIIFPRGGGYSLTFPVSANDECLTLFASRCIDNWWQHGDVQPQYEQRMHDLSDGFALTGPYSQKNKISAVSTTTTQLRTDDGTLFVEIDLPNKKVRLVSNGDIIDVDSNANTISITAASQVNITSPITLITGDLRVTGLVTAGYGGGDQVGLQTHQHTQGADAHGDAEVPTQAPTPGT